MTVVSLMPMMIRKQASSSIYKYWRVTILTKSEFTDYPVGGSFHFYSGAINLAGTQIAATVSQESSIYLPEYGLNDYPGMFWIAEDNVLPVWIQGEYASPIAVTGIEIYIPSIVFSFDAFNISGSNDGTNFDLVYSGNMNSTSGPTFFSF